MTFFKRSFIGVRSSNGPGLVQPGGTCKYLISNEYFQLVQVVQAFLMP